MTREERDKSIKPFIDQNLTGYRSLDVDAGYEIDGSDLIIPDPETALSAVWGRLVVMKEKAETGTLTSKNVDMWLGEEAESVREVILRYLNDIKEEHPKYVAAIQEWAAEEVQDRESEAPESSDEHLKMVDALTRMLDELDKENEDPELIRIASLWREEEFAAYCAGEAQELVRQAA